MGVGSWEMGEVWEMGAKTLEIPLNLSWKATVYTHL